jgi:SpoIID/LytB domain protein
MLGINKEPEISVGILSEEKIEFELYGDFKSADISENLSGRFTAGIAGDKIICKTDSSIIESKDEIIFVPKDIKSDSFLIKNVTIGVKFHWERKEKQRFNGILKLKKDKNKVTVINIISIENYLISVISSEMSAKSTLDFLKAHAIVSRSWFLAQIQKSKALKKGKTKYSTVYNTDKEHLRWYDREEHQLFDVCADDHCQRYQGITKIFTSVAKQAVEETRGIVLVSDNKICDARYSKSCGGISESFENVWEPVKYSYLTSVIDYKFEPENFSTDFSKENNAAKWIKGSPTSFCNTRDEKVLSQVLLDYDQETLDFFRWKIEYTQEEISELIKLKSGIDFGKIIDLVPVERGNSSRLSKLKIIGTKKTLIIGKELEIRKFLSPTHLYSSAIIIEKENIEENIPKKFIIRGAGWGHGVGLCQIGAALMGSQGYRFDEILLHYFTAAEIKKIYQ